MTDNNDKINELLNKLESLLRRQDDFSREINSLRTEIHRLKISETEQTTENEKITLDQPVIARDIETIKDNITAVYQANQKQTPKGKSDLEKFIGENLINKIGIVITVIGVVIGAKYSIENDLISCNAKNELNYNSHFPRTTPAKSGTAKNDKLNSFRKAPQR